MEPLKTQAIQIALNGNWDLAVKINQEILKENPDDLNTLNRLAFAYTALGEIAKAKKTYEKVLEIDEGNPIAQKNLKKLGNTTKPVMSGHIVSNMFLEESGKTKVVTLLNTAPPKILRSLQIGQEIVLCIKRFKIFVLNGQEYIGVLPDNISKRLIEFLKGGNKYDAYIRSVEEKAVTVFIREVKRAARFKNQPTFLFGETVELSLHQKQEKKRASEEIDE